MYLYIRASLLDEDGYFNEKELVKPSRDWTHLAFVYYNVQLTDERVSSIGLFVNGDLTLSDFNRKPRDSEPANGTIVLGRPYTAVDNYYTSMEVDELVFYNSAKGVEQIKTMYETGGLYPE